MHSHLVTGFQLFEDTFWALGSGQLGQWKAAASGGLLAAGGLAPAAAPPPRASASPGTVPGEPGAALCSSPLSSGGLVYSLSSVCLWTGSDKLVHVEIEMANKA